MEQMRLNKLLSTAGVCSRRAADRLILSGQVLVNHRPAELGTMVSREDSVTIDGRVIAWPDDGPHIYLAFNKPPGVVTTAAPDEPDNIIDFIGLDERVYPVGRLDKASRGLILLTNDGEMADLVMRAGDHHEKEYIVQVDRPVDEAFIKGMSSGVPILGKRTNPCPVTKLGKHRFRIILDQGMNRQIRRMCEYFGYRVLDLQRVRINNIRLGDLPEGRWREVPAKEIEALMEEVRNGDPGRKGRKRR